LQVPLIAEHEIVNLPSASILSVLRREVSTRKAAPKSVMVVADPVFDSHDDRLRGALETLKTIEVSANLSEITDQFSLDRSAREVGAARGGIFPRLPFSRREAEAIYAMATPGEANKALDFDASKATAMSKELGEYKIVHLATHGLVNSEHPALSGLVFSLLDRQGRSQDGFLRLSDIYNLELNADLVVLSACQTALGKQINGEGLIGITRGFMYAGSPRVIASLWNADDEATAELMKKFYEGVLKNGQRPAEALRAAQTWMLKQPRWKAPYYWAGFVLQGEWK
jgi:CHAT domain-containing protein